MLVLSRRAQQEIVFPNLGIRINVLKVQGKLVKLGIEAPPEVAVLRKEANAGSEAADSEAKGAAEHRRRNELNLLHLRVAALQRRIDRGEQVDLLSAFTELVDHYAGVDRALAPSEQVSGDPGRLRRLLVVEDSDNERQLLAYLLASHGFDVQVARDGQEALDCLSEGLFRPEFVLMDMQMPVINGAETLELIRADDRFADTKVFAVTGQRFEDEPNATKWDGWFQKPVNIQSLLATLDTACETACSF